MSDLSLIFSDEWQASLCYKLVVSDSYMKRGLGKGEAHLKRDNSWYKCGLYIYLSSCESKDIKNYSFFMSDLTRCFSDPHQNESASYVLSLLCEWSSFR